MRGLRFILAWVAVGDLFGQSVGQPSQYGGDIRAEWPRVGVPEGAGAGRDTEPAPQWEVVEAKLRELTHSPAARFRWTLICDTRSDICPT